jgi:hypothetical protein
MFSLHRLFLSGAGMFLLVVLAGCQDGGPKVVKVTGTLTYKGKPVPNTHIFFEPEKGRQSWAETDGEGRFKVNYDAHQDGAVVGKHKVWVEMRSATTPDQEGVLPGKQPRMSKEMATFLDKYSAEKSKLTIDITPDTRDLKLDLN